MKMKSFAAGLAVAGGIAAWAPTANALIVLDSWQLDTTNAGIASLTTDIGHLNLSGGLATVNQQIDGSGNPFAGAAFREFGLIFSSAITQNNVVGSGDSGFPTPYAAPLDGLRFVFTGLAGTVTAFNSGTGAVDYAFTPGVGSVVIEGTVDSGASWTTLANLAVASPSGGSLNDFGGATGTNGDSTLLNLILAGGYTSNLFRDSTGTSLDPYVTGILAPGLFLNARTNNEISSPATGPTPCTWDASLACATIQVTSNGSADLLSVPEPGTLALLGVGLLGLGAGRLRRRRSS